MMMVSSCFHTGGWRVFVSVSASTLSLVLSLNAMQTHANGLNRRIAGVTQSVCTTSTHPCWAQYNTGPSHKFTLLWLLSTSLICSLQILLACAAEAWTAPDLFALSCFVRTSRKIQLNGLPYKTRSPATEQWELAALITPRVCYATSL